MLLHWYKLYIMPNIQQWTFLMWKNFIMKLRFSQVVRSSDKPLVFFPQNCPWRWMAHGLTLDIQECIFPRASLVWLTGTPPPALNPFSLLLLGLGGPVEKQTSSTVWTGDPTRVPALLETRWFIHSLFYFFVSFLDNPGSDLVPHHCGHQLQGAEEDPGPVPHGDLREPGGSRVQAARLWLQRRVFARGTSCAAMCVLQ